MTAEMILMASIVRSKINTVDVNVCIRKKRANALLNGVSLTEDAMCK